MLKTTIPRALLALILLSLGALDIALAQRLRQLGADPCAPDSTANRSALMASPADRNRSAIPLGIREFLLSIRREPPVSAQCAEALRSVAQLSRLSERQPVRSGPVGQLVRRGPNSPGGINNPFVSKVRTVLAAPTTRSARVGKSRVTADASP
jgi:hypothetical protein